MKKVSALLPLLFFFTAICWLAVLGITYFVKDGFRPNWLLILQAVNFLLCLLAAVVNLIKRNKYKREVAAAKAEEKTAAAVEAAVANAKAEAEAAAEAAAETAADIGESV